MKKIYIALAAATLTGTAIFADSVSANMNAWFDLKTHTTVGYNLEDNIFGMESSLDQAQIWWEIFPYATRGAEPSEGDALQASVRIEGLKYAFKFYNEKKTYQDGTTTGYQENPGGTNDKSTNYFDYTRIVSDVQYKSWFMEFYNYDYEDGTAVGFSDASIHSLFDDFRNTHIFDSDKDNAVGILYFNGIKDQRNIITKDGYGLTGILSTGLNLDNVKIRLSAGTPGSWIDREGEEPGNIKSGKAYQKVNSGNKAVFQLDGEYIPLENLTLKADGLMTLNYSKTENDTATDYAHDVYTCGFSGTYDYSLAKGTLSPYAGLDFNYTDGRDGDDAQFEAGAGVAYYWRGKDFKTNYDVLDFWGRKFPVGASLGINMDQNYTANLVFSVLEKADKDALIPNLGGFFEFEYLNIAQQNSKDSSVFAAGQAEYLINVPVAKRKTIGVKPYLFGRFIQVRGTDGKITKEYNVDTRAGVLVYPCARFSIDLRYERADIIYDIAGKDNDLDKGCITCKFSVNL